MSEMNNIKDYLISLGASKVGFADVNGLASEFIDLPNAISIVMKIPKETIQLVKDENYEEMADNNSITNNITSNG